MFRLTEVIESGQIDFPSYKLFQNGLFQLENIYFTITIVVIILISIKALRDNIRSVKYTCIIVGAFVLGLFAFNSANDYREALNEAYSNVDNWREQVVRPYLNKAEISKAEVSYFKISDTPPPKSEFWYGNKSLYHNLDLEFSTVTYGDNITYSGWFLVKEDLKSNDKKYIEFVNIESELGNGVDAGLYNAVVHVPNDYFKKKSQ